MTGDIEAKQVDIKLGYEFTTVDTPNVIYSQNGESKRMEDGLIKLISRKTNRYFFLITTPKMRKESADFITNMMNRKEKKKLKNFEFVFVDEDKDPDEEIFKLAKLKKGSVISNDKFRQKKYDKYRGKGIKIWKYKSRNSDYCLVMYDSWFL